MYTVVLKYVKNFFKKPDHLIMFNKLSRDIIPQNTERLWIFKKKYCGFITCVCLLISNSTAYNVHIKFYSHDLIYFTPSTVFSSTVTVRLKL